MDQPGTCGQGLAHHAALPAKLADVFAAIADTLETHLSAIDPTEKGSRPEFDAYVALATDHREIESRLRAVSMQMEEYRDLPMASHDVAIMTSPKTASSDSSSRRKPSPRCCRPKSRIAGRCRTRGEPVARGVGCNFRRAPLENCTRPSQNRNAEPERGTGTRNWNHTQC